ncbi:MAG: LysM peptidoglycan-binding domain-containing protein [Elusimicrobiota bacterium]
MFFEFKDRFTKILIVIFLFNLLPFSELFADNGEEQVGELTASGESPVNLLEIRVESGDTLSKFADKYLDDPQKWPQLLEYNEIPSGDPNLIVPGEKLKVPEELVKDEIADIIHMRNDVRMRRQDTASWEEADMYQRLYPEDGIRTAANSGAKLEYLKGGVADIGENSLVFLKPDETRDDIVEVEAGELYAEDIKVLTETASIDPKTGSKYKTVVDEEQATTLSVYEGEVDFISAGEMKTVEEGFMSEAKLNEAPSDPMKLPDPPEINEDEFKDGEAQSTVQSSSQLDIEKMVSRVSSGDKEQSSNQNEFEKVHIQIAQDKDFSRVVVDRKVDKVTPDDIKEDLMDGEYWWRAAFVNKNGVGGEFSDPMPMIVDTNPPSLKISNPADGEKIAKNIISLKGKTEPYAKVVVNDNKVKVDNDGNFVTAVRIKVGENNINVKSRDTEGRVTEKKLTVEGTPQIKTNSDQEMLVKAGIAASALSVVAIVLSILQ